MTGTSGHSERGGAGKPPKHRALVGGTLINGSGEEPIERGTLLIEGAKITGIGAQAHVPIPDQTEIIDVGGRYVLPGLIDANVHLVPWPSWTFIEFLARYEGRFEAIIEEAAQIALRHGFTTVFDSMGPLAPLMAVRDSIDKGDVLGSRIRVAGNIVGFRAVFTTPEAMASATKPFQRRMNDLFEAGGGADLGWCAPDELYDRMRAYVAQGVDFVKYGATGDGEPVNSEVGQEAVLRFSPEQQRAIVQSVHDADKTVQTHTTSAESLHIAVQVGNDMGQHASITRHSRIYESTISLMREQHYSCGTQWDPLTADEQEFLRRGDSWHSKSALSRDRAYELENAVRLIEAGIPQLVSTDAGTIDPDVMEHFAPDAVPGGLGRVTSLLGEAEFLNMRGMRQRGMTPMQIIRAATQNIARAYKCDDEFGTLEIGKAADVVVVDRDPLVDPENLRQVSLVLKGGVPVVREDLPERPVLTSQESISAGVRSR
ncbi:MAG: amidohydrolase family protein [Nocardiopsaceae bacterium]|jgi:imidazolonepropionase-like amidohydrolase|nr:amidohydrolase family protein [Nocardiopsaceae bacterium]